MTNKTKPQTHTPGPWTVHEYKTGKISVWPEDQSFEMPARDVPCMANARLIAAAPDLLAALKHQHLALLHKIYRGSTDDEAQELHRIACSNCSSCAAIAKATGGR